MPDGYLCRDFQLSKVQIDRHTPDTGVVRGFPKNCATACLAAAKCQFLIALNIAQGSILWCGHRNIRTI